MSESTSKTDGRRLRIMFICLVCNAAFMIAMILRFHFDNDVAAASFIVGWALGVTVMVVPQIVGGKHDSRRS